MQFYVYAHRRNDTGAVFYIGKGCGKRAWKKSDRSQWWKNIEAKHGRSVEIIASGLSEDEAFNLEQETIEKYGRENLCNLTGGGLGGISPSDETKKKMSIAKIGRKISASTREKMRIASTGRECKPETREKLRAANLGKDGVKHSDETRLKISIAKSGIIRTPEHCAAISFGKKGKSTGPMHENTKAALIKANVGRRHSDESKRKISEATKGKKHSPESIKKLTESNQKNNALRRRAIKCSNGMLFSFSVEAQDWLRDNGYPAASRANIVSCCTGKLKTAYGFTWQFADGSPS